MAYMNRFGQESGWPYQEHHVLDGQKWRLAIVARLWRFMVIQPGMPMDITASDVNQQQVDGRHNGWSFDCSFSHEYQETSWDYWKDDWCRCPLERLCNSTGDTKWNDRNNKLYVNYTIIVNSRTTIMQAQTGRSVISSEKNSAEHMKGVMNTKWNPRTRELTVIYDAKVTFFSSLLRYSFL